MPPHDALFKLAVGNVDAARSLLRVVLPKAVLDALDVSTLRVTPGSFVSDSLRERFADALLEVESRGDPTLIHILFEHKSEPERFTIVDLFDSSARIWKSWLRNHKNTTTVPRVLPIVFHHGSAAWSQPQDIREVLAGDAEIARVFEAYDPVFPIVFFDLGGVDDPDAAIRNIDDPLARCVTFLLLVSRMRRFVEHLKRTGFGLITKLWHLPNGESLVRPLLHYVLVLAPDDTDPTEFFDMTAKYIDPEAEKTMRTLKDVFLDQGRELGRNEGRQEGRQEGEALAILEILSARFGRQAEAVRARLLKVRDSGLLLRLVSVAMNTESIARFADELPEV